MLDTTSKHYLPVPLFAFVAWLLLLLVSVSTPITKSIYLAQVAANVNVGGPFHLAEAQTAVRFGVSGWCSSPFHAEVAGIIQDNTPAQCSPKKLGYTFDSQVLDLLHINIDKNISTTLTFGLSTHIVAAVLSFVALLTSLVAIWRMSRLSAGITTVFLLLATLFALIAFIFDAVFVKTVKHLLDVQNTISVKTGNGTWMTLSAFLLLTLTSIMSCIGFIRAFRARAYVNNNIDNEKTAARY